MIAELPARPVAPVAPVTPIAPSAPVAPVAPVGPVAVSYTHLYVIYDQVGEVKKTWAGTDQYEASSYAYGLIKKKDYWNNKVDYIPVDVIVKGE